MQMTRRQFAQSTAGAIAATSLTPLLSRAFAHQQGPLDWRRISDDARVIEGMGGNAMILTSRKDVLLIDTKVAAVGKMARGLVESGRYKVTQVVNTHHHADHTGGNFAWSPDTPILAHEIAKERVLKQHKIYADSIKRQDPEAPIPDAEAFAPTQTTPGDTEITIGNYKVILRFFGPGHTDNDLAVFIPNENILHAGDLLFNKMHIFVDLKGGASTKGWMANVEELIKLCDNRTTVIPGHGPVTNVRGLEKQRDYIKQLREIVTEAIAAGKSREETYRTPVPGTEKYEFARGLPNALSAIYTEMTGEPDNKAGG